ncbi:phenol hydroxylase subunit [Marinobacterium jannaschii]|uniref:phenol hydroxylase subunit n=1 Tax=Marinobacterium jannaschii TaxID=64970 RepID=UPI00047F4F0D|nr:phenol hydroxylase subunit [Marinobacterium jannaschii]
MATAQPDNSTPSTSPGAFENLVKYVRVRSSENARFVEFDFAISDPSLFVELVMPRGAFDLFCQKHRVVHMSTAQMAAVDAEMEKWRYGTETLMAENHAHSGQ